MNNKYAKFEYKGMKTILVTDYTQITQCKHAKGGVDVTMSKSSTLPKMLSNVPKIRGAYLQCVNNHNAKFEYKE